MPINRTICCFSGFLSLKSADNQDIIKVPGYEKEIKYKFLNKWIVETIELIKTLDEVKFSESISYLLLSLCYRVDYLLAPQGKLMDDLELMQRVYFAKDQQPYEQKNYKIIGEFEKILHEPKNKIMENLYRVKATFGIMPAKNHTTVVDFFKREIKNTGWYIDNNYANIAVAIYEYCLFVFFF